MLLNEKIEILIEPVLQSLGLECVRVIVADTGRHKTVQIMVDRIDGDGVGLSDCQSASREISAILDVEDIISGRYNLEVSSPGISRPILKLSDWEKFIGRAVNVKANVAIVGNAKSYKGKIVSVVNDVITIDADQGDSKFAHVDIRFNLIEKANLIQMQDDFRKILQQRKKDNKKK